MSPNKEVENHSTKVADNRVEITAQLVRQVTDRVYAMWLRELQIEKERRRRYDQRYRR